MKAALSVTSTPTVASPGGGDGDGRASPVPLTAAPEQAMSTPLPSLRSGQKNPSSTNSEKFACSSGVGGPSTPERLREGDAHAIPGSQSPRSALGREDSGAPATVGYTDENRRCGRRCTRAACVGVRARRKPGAGRHGERLRAHDECLWTTPPFTCAHGREQRIILTRCGDDRATPAICGVAIDVPDMIQTGARAPRSRCCRWHGDLGLEAQVGGGPASGSFRHGVLAGATTLLGATLVVGGASMASPVRLRNECGTPSAARPMTTRSQMGTLL